MEKRKNMVDPTRYVTVTNLDGTKAELLRESYQDYERLIQQTLQDQDKCRKCDGIHCSQHEPYWVLLVRSGIDSTPTPAMARCPKHGCPLRPAPRKGRRMGLPSRFCTRTQRSLITKSRRTTARQWKVCRAI